MIYFIGAGPGAADLITVRGAEILRRSEIIIYAGSLVNSDIINLYARPECKVYNSASMTLEEIIMIMVSGHQNGKIIARLHSGDPALYGAIREQINILRGKNIPFEIVPGVSSLFAASAVLKTEYMIPEKTQTLIISRLDGRTHTPENESIKSLAVHGCSMALFLSAGMIKNLCSELISGGYAPETPAAVVYKASWPDEKIILSDLCTLPKLAEHAGIHKTALILVGDFLNYECNTRSKLYDENFSHEFRK